MSDSLFSDVRSISRGSDNLADAYTTSAVIKRIWRDNLRPRFPLLALAVFAMALAAATTGAIPFLIQITADEVFAAKRAELIYPIVGGIIAIGLLKAVAEYIADVTVNYLGHRFIADLRIAMFERISNADLSWIQDVHSGRLISSFLNDATLIRGTASRTMVGLVENSLKVAILLAAMAWMDLRFTLVISVFLPIALFVLSRQQRKMRKSTTKSLQETGDLSALVSQTLRGIRVVRAYGQEAAETERAKNTINRALEFTMRGARARAASGPTIEILVGMGFALAIFFAARRGAMGTLTIGHFMGFMASAMLIYQPLKGVATLQTAIQEGIAAASRIFSIIDRERQLSEAPDAKPLKLAEGEITFDNVSFAYSGGRPVLRSVALTVPAGKTVAIVGPSGAGKSTLVNLVLRFFEPVEGRVLIDGQDISKATIRSLRDAIALVTQDPVLFDDTMYANIAYGHKATEREAVIAAAKSAAAHDFIEALPHGYDTRAGEAGDMLSGGEKQRIAIARALYKDARILLLDEPTSSLDSHAEAKVQDALDRLMRGRTVLMIAHRLSTVKNADMICVLEGGRIVESGRHEDLLAAGGAYAKLHAAQFKDMPLREQRCRETTKKAPRALAGE